MRFSLSLSLLPISELDKTKTKLQSDRVHIHARVALQPLVRHSGCFIGFQLPDAADSQVTGQPVASNPHPLERHHVRSGSRHQLAHLVVAALAHDNADAVARQRVPAALGRGSVDRQGLDQSSVDLAAVGDGLELFPRGFPRERGDVLAGEALVGCFFIFILFFFPEEGGMKKRVSVF